MSLWLFFKDELKGFYKSKVMIILWIGMPLSVILLHLIIPNLDGVPISPIIGLLLGNIGGTLASAMLGTTIVNEKNKNVYDLFLIRPIKRHNLMIAKFLATILCLIIATVISLIIGLIIDSITTEIELKNLINGLWEGTMIAIMTMAIAVSAGILIGLLTKTVMVAAILALFVGSQLSSLPMILPLIISLQPELFGELNSGVISLIIGIPLTFLMIIISSLVVNRKEF